MKKVTKKYFIIRVLVFPLVFATILIKSVYDAMVLSFDILWNGFEIVKLKHDRPTLKEIYEKVSELVDNSNPTM